MVDSRRSEGLSRIFRQHIQFLSMNCFTSLS
jgi:hypothetical protein